MLFRICQLVLICIFILDAWAEYVQCETSSGSPPADDCWTAKEIISHPEKVNGGVPECFPTNSKGSGCKKVIWSGQCAIVICRDDGGLDLKVHKIAVQTAAQILHDICKSGGKVGGFIQYDSMGAKNNGTKCSPKEGDSKDRSFNVEFVKIKQDD
ncbi:hypothetical protein F5B20DRAFT_583113 [Whalleya microplaca]|nr:hypothetical protein F5B20DRAFT_583113 [Whalleya microplaca]